MTPSEFKGRKRAPGFLGTTGAARIVGVVGPSGIRKWCDEGIVRSGTDILGWRYIREVDVWLLKKRLDSGWRPYPRGQKGENNHAAKMTNAQAERAYLAWLDGESQTSIARRMGVRKQTIWALVHGETFTNVTEKYRRTHAGL